MEAGLAAWASNLGPGGIREAAPHIARSQQLQAELLDAEREVEILEARLAESLGEREDEGVQAIGQMASLDDLVEAAEGVLREDEEVEAERLRQTRQCGRCGQYVAVMSWELHATTCPEGSHGPVPSPDGAGETPGWNMFSLAKVVLCIGGGLCPTRCRWALLE